MKKKKCADCGTEEIMKFPVNLRRNLCRTCHTKRQKAMTRRQREKMGEAAWFLLQKEKHIKRKYGISLERWDEMFAAQNGECAICRKGDIKLVVDHNHETGEVRGLLCGPCNLGLGHFNDSLELLILATGYLYNSPS